VRLSLCVRRMSVVADVVVTVDAVEDVEATKTVEAEEATTTVEAEVATTTAADEAATTMVEVAEAMTTAVAVEVTTTIAAAGTTGIRAVTGVNRTSPHPSPTRGHHHQGAPTSFPRRRQAGFPLHSTEVTRALEAMEAHPAHRPRSALLG
jgi:hypothetical protein